MRLFFLFFTILFETYFCFSGDVLGTIGSYTLAVLAKHHSIAFYVAARSSIWRQVELPDPESLQGSFADVTPAHLISAYLTDLGVFQARSFARDMLMARARASDTQTSEELFLRP